MTTTRAVLILPAAARNDVVIIIAGESSDPKSFPEKRSIGSFFEITETKIYAWRKDNRMSGKPPLVSTHVDWEEPIVVAILRYYRDYMGGRTAPISTHSYIYIYDMITCIIIIIIIIMYVMT